MARSSASLPHPRRLAALRATGLLDTPPEDAFDRLARIAATLLRAPFAALSLVDDRRVFFKSVAAPGGAWPYGREAPVSDVFCSRVVSARRRLLVEDAREDEAWRTHPAVVERGIAAYAGMPVHGAGGTQVIGSFCVMDTDPHRWARDDLRGLGELAAAAEEVIGRPARESEARHRLVMHATGDTVLEWTVATGALRWDGAGPRMLRYTPEEAGGAIGWFYDRIHPDDRERVVREHEALLSGIDALWSGEYRVLLGDGGCSWILHRACVERDHRGRPLRVVGSLMDVTNRRYGEEAQRFLASASTLLDSSLDYETTLSGLARLAVPTRADYCLVDLVDDGKWARRVGTAHANPALQGRLRTREVVSLDADPERHPVVKVIRTGSATLVSDCTPEVLDRIAHDAEHRAGLESLGLRSFMIVPLVARERVLGAITLVSSESGRRFQPMDLVVAEDLARRAATAIEHARLYREVQQAVLDREEVLGFVTHDLRNPLNTIYTAASYLLESGAEARPHDRRWLETIELASNQMNSLIDELFQVARMGTGAFTLDAAPHEVAAVVRAASDLLAPLARAGRLRFTWEVEEGLPPLWMDRDKVLRVLSNLVGNAFKFTPEGGSVALRVAAEGSPAEAVRFAVEDSGPGIDEGALARVFERYWQGRQGDRRGAGMGLAIVKGVVEAHGGRVMAGNRAEGGARFVFTLPVRAPPPPSDPPRPSA